MYEPLPRGAILDPQYIDASDLLNASHGFGLWDDGSDAYPAVTSDGGKTWRVDGPIFHVAAADANAVVTAISAAAPDTVVAFGGPAVDVTTDGGLHWSTTNFPGGVWAVGVNNGTVTAYAGTTWSYDGPVALYQSRDGGLHWTYHPTAPAEIRLRCYHCTDHPESHSSIKLVTEHVCVHDSDSEQARGLSESPGHRLLKARS